MGDTMSRDELAYWLTAETPEAVTWRTEAPLDEWAALLVGYRRGLPVARPAALAGKQATSTSDERNGNEVARAQ